MRSGRVRQLRGIGPSIEAKLRELVETGAIAELAELERELAPDLVGFGRYLGLTAKRTLELARALDVRTAGELRDAALAGRLQSARGVGPKTEARLLEALARAEQPRPRQGLLLNRARELVGAIAQGLGATIAGDPRRWRDSCEHLAVVCAAADPRPVLTRFVELPQVVALLSARSAAWWASPSTASRSSSSSPRPSGSGPPSSSTRAPPPGSTPCARSRTRPTRRASSARSASRGGRPSCARPAASRHVTAAAAARARRHPRRPAQSHDVVRRARERGGDGPRGPRPRLRVPRDLRPHARGRRRPGLTADDVRRQAEEIAAANAALAPFRVLRGIECDILPDGRLDLPDDVLAELDWVQASVHGGQRMPARQMTDRVLEALRNPYVRCLSHPTGRYIHRRPENALDLDRVFEVALEHDVALEINGLPLRLDLRAEHVRDAVRAGITLVCSTDAHSPRGSRTCSTRSRRPAAAARPPTTSSTRGPGRSDAQW